MWLVCRISASCISEQRTVQPLIFDSTRRLFVMPSPSSPLPSSRHRALHQQYDSRSSPHRYCPLTSSSPRVSRHPLSPLTYTRRHNNERDRNAEGDEDKHSHADDEAVSSTSSGKSSPNNEGSCVLQEIKRDEGASSQRGEFMSSGFCSLLRGLSFGVNHASFYQQLLILHYILEVQHYLRS